MIRDCPNLGAIVLYYINTLLLKPYDHNDLDDAVHMFCFLRNPFNPVFLVFGFLIVIIIWNFILFPILFKCISIPINFILNLLLRKDKNIDSGIYVEMNFKKIIVISENQS